MVGFYAGQVVSGIAVRVAVGAHPHMPDAVELQLWVDGQDLVAPVFDVGPNEDPDKLLGSRGTLMPAHEARENKLAEASCTEGCCGAIYVRIRRDGDQIVRDSWRNPGDRSTRRDTGSGCLRAVGGIGPRSWAAVCGGGWGGKT